ncbi:O-antigen ligase [Massilia sp. CF038]|uniref:O-antigen ligase family protein n=1 Tax=Massilia sp. CF038 TaxID=1881045 RepID=UPI00091B214F|nr:O-antigen ligase family protein [Massilia sp. CF038]SHH11848.1 O-antigen ligase [Massilia sp. CF038]
MKPAALPAMPFAPVRQFGAPLLALFAILVGMAVPGFVSAVDGSVAKAMILPAVLLLVMLLVASRVLLLTGILLLRAFCDVFFDATRISLGGTQIGVGFLVNVFIIMIALLLVIEKPKLLPKKMFLLWVPLLLCGLGAVIMAPSKADALRAYLAQLSYCAVFVSAFYVVRTPDDFKRCARIVLYSSVLPLIYGLVDIAIKGGVHGPNGARLQSTFAHPNIYAFYLTLVIGLGFYILKSDTYKLAQRERVGLSAYLALLFAMLALTQTRSAWIACGALFLGYGLLFERRYLIYMLVVPLLALLIPDVRDRVLDLGAGNEVKLYAKLNSFAWRLYIWESGLNWMRPSHYLFGYGLESFQFYSPTFFPLAGKTHFGAHSMYVQWLFELGAIGTLACLWVYGRVMWTLKGMVTVNRLGAFVLIVMMLQYLIVSASDNMSAYLAFNWYFWFVLGSGCALLAHGAPTKEGV